jgi:Ankyrin repeat
MSTSELPARPSLDSLRKQAKKLARDIATRDAVAIARARAQLPQAELPLSQRDAQLVLAREYGFPGWKDLVKEVKQRLGRGLEWGVSEARRIIHDNDVEGLRRLLADYPALLSWRGPAWNSPGSYSATTADRRGENDRGLLGMATGSFGDSFDPVSEEHFTRRECAELLLDAGAVVEPSVCDGLINSRARGLIDLFHRRGLLPRSLKFFAMLGDIDDVRTSLDTEGDDRAAVNLAFITACRFQHAPAATLLLDRLIRLDAELGRRIDGGPGRSAFVQFFIANPPGRDPDPPEPWQAFVMKQLWRARGDGDLTSFVGILRREGWILSDAFVKFQVDWIEDTVALLGDYSAFLKALLDLDPAVLHRPVPPSSGITHDGTVRAFIHAFTYVQPRAIPLLLRIWPMPDDLPHAAGSGDFARVKRWFDADGRPALGDLANHFPAHDAWIRGNLQWGEPNVQQVLDTAFALAVMNNHFEIADFLLAQGANINTTWSSHEPASILHELVWHKNYEAMQFLIDRGIDMTTLDYRWHATAEGWARVAAKDEKLGQFLHDAQQRREQASH